MVKLFSPFDFYRDPEIFIRPGETVQPSQEPVQQEQIQPVADDPQKCPGCGQVGGNGTVAKQFTFYPGTIHVKCALCGDNKIKF